MKIFNFNLRDTVKNEFDKVLRIAANSEESAKVYLANCYGLNFDDWDLVDSEEHLNDNYVNYPYMYYHNFEKKIINRNTNYIIKYL